jgi:hypothetical protein
MISSLVMKLRPAPHAEPAQYTANLCSRTSRRATLFPSYRRRFQNPKDILSILRYFLKILRDILSIPKYFLSILRYFLPILRDIF